LDCRWDHENVLFYGVEDKILYRIIFKKSVIYIVIQLLFLNTVATCCVSLGVKIDKKYFLALFS